MLLTEEQMRDQIREYWKVSEQHERLGQWLMNRMPLKLTDSDLFYEKNDNVAVHKYQTRYVVASDQEIMAWNVACSNQDIPKLNIQEVQDLIRNIEFNTSGSQTTCTLTTTSGFKANGESGTVHKDRFNEDIGKRFSFEKAFNNLVEHHSYLVRYNLEKADLALAQVKPKYVQEDDGA